MTKRLRQACCGPQTRIYSCESHNLAVELLLLKYGYLLLFVGVIFEGEAVLIAGSFLASRGYFNISTVALVALAANTMSAQFYYKIGRASCRERVLMSVEETALEKIEEIVRLYDA